MRKMSFFAVALCLALAVLSTAALAQTAADLDFQKRRSGPGVVNSVNFDSPASVRQYLEPAWDGVYHGTVDTSVKASGAGSLRFTIPESSRANAAGSFTLNFASNFSRQFGEGGEFYIQWRQRFSSSFLETNFGGDGWKQIIVGEGDRANQGAPGCSELEIVMHNSYFRGLPELYHSCHRFLNLSMPTAGGDILLQPGNADGDCLYSKNPGGKLIGNPPCFVYRADEWMTFQMHVKIGHWNMPDSLVEVWGSHEGQPSVRFISMDNYTLHNSDPLHKYGKLYLTPYMTSREQNKITPIAYTWYDELIISTSKIPDPKTP